jgi:hypothetical protein
MESYAMKRQTFLTIAASVGILFSIFMLASPSEMIKSMGAQPGDLSDALIQVMSVLLFSISLITFLARKDQGSLALRAIIIGSLVMHIGSIPIDWIAFRHGTFTQISGLIPGTCIHIIFTIGFILTFKNLKIK